MLIVVLFSVNESFAQVKNKFFIGDTTCSLQCYLDKYIASGDQNILNSHCITSVIFIQFNLNQDGTVTNIQFNNETPEILKPWFTSFLQSTNKKWIYKRVSDTEVTLTNSKTKFMLPVAVVLTKTGCKEPINNVLESVLNMLNHTPADQKKTPHFLHYTGEDFFNGVFLNPLFIMSGNHQ